MYLKHLLVELHAHLQWNMYIKTTLGTNKMWALYTGGLYMQVLLYAWKIYPCRPVKCSFYKQLVCIYIGGLEIEHVWLPQNTNCRWLRFPKSMNTWLSSQPINMRNGYRNYSSLYLTTIYFKITLDYKTAWFGPKGQFSALNVLYFKTTCSIKPHFLGPMGGLKIGGPLYQPCLLLHWQIANREPAKRPSIPAALVAKPVEMLALGLDTTGTYMALDNFLFCRGTSHTQVSFFGEKKVEFSWPSYVEDETVKRVSRAG